MPLPLFSLGFVLCMVPYLILCKPFFPTSFNLKLLDLSDQFWPLLIWICMIIFIPPKQLTVFFFVLLYSQFGFLSHYFLSFWHFFSILCFQWLACTPRELDLWVTDLRKSSVKLIVHHKEIFLDLPVWRHLPVLLLPGDQRIQLCQILALHQLLSAMWLMKICGWKWTMVTLRILIHFKLLPFEKFNHSHQVKQFLLVYLSFLLMSCSFLSFLLLSRHIWWRLLFNEFYISLHCWFHQFYQNSI